MMIADRMKLIDSSGIRKVFELAKSMKSPVNLSIGQPDFDIPDPLKDEAVFAIKDGFNHYTVTQGIDALRKEVAEELDKKKIYYEDTLITSGVSGGLFLAFMACINPGDEVIIPDPYFVMYKYFVLLMGGVPRYLDMYPDFKLNHERLESLINEKTKMIVINSPSNPTGTVFTEDELAEIAEIAGKKDILIVSDEIYDSFSYDDVSHNMGKFYKKTLTLNGFSKSHSMTGWRVGYAAGPEELIKEMIKLQQYSFVCAPSFAQKAAVKAVKFPMGEYISEYREKRDLIYEGLKDNFNVVKPQGAFYIFPEAPNGSGSKFVEEAIKNNVLVIPGNVFSRHDTHFRVSYASDCDTIKRGIDILNELSKKMSGTI